MVASEIEMTPEDTGSPESKSLRIGYLLPQFPVATQVFAVSDIAALRALGHEVVVHTIKAARRDEDARMRTASVPDDLPIRRPSLRGALRWPSLVWRYRAEVGFLIGRILAHGLSQPIAAATAFLCIPRVLEIADDIARDGTDVAHVFWARHPGMALPVLARTGAPAVRSTFVGAYDLVADDFLVELSLEWSELAFSHAETNREFLVSRAPVGVPVRIIHRGIPLMERDPAILRDSDLWLTASALTVEKNVEAVLRAFAAARTGKPSLRLEVCGEGPDRARLEHLCDELGCRDVVTFRGHVGREELFGHMQRAALFLLLSKKASERLPNVVKEALWAGCAVISSRSEGIEELLPDTGIGHIVDADRPEAIASAVAAAMAEGQAEAETRRARGAELVAERFSSSRSMGRYADAWQDAIRARDVASVRQRKPVAPAVVRGRDENLINV